MWHERCSWRRLGIKLFITVMRAGHIAMEFLDEGISRQACPEPPVNVCGDGEPAVKRVIPEIASGSQHISSREKGELNVARKLIATPFSIRGQGIQQWRRRLHLTMQACTVRFRRNRFLTPVTPTLPCLTISSTRAMNADEKTLSRVVIEAIIPPVTATAST